MPYMGTKSSFFDIRILYWDRERGRRESEERASWRGISVAISVSYHYKREMSSLRL